MPEKQTIKDTLKVIRKALEDDKPPDLENIHDTVLILNKLINDDGTINIIDNSSIKKKDVQIILYKKLDEVFDKYFTIWLDKNIPQYLDKYFKNKNI